jgi:protein-S-isoprenylcysteine O-methyltransferase Ste14
VAAELLNRIVLYIPNIIVAIFILIIGMFMATLLRNIVKTAASNSGISHSNILAKIVEVVVLVFAVMVALEQLNIASRIIELVITVTLGSFGLAFALAFGFGCQDVAKKTVNDIIEKLKRK